MNKYTNKVVFFRNPLPISQSSKLFKCSCYPRSSPRGSSGFYFIPPHNLNVNHAAEFHDWQQLSRLWELDPAILKLLSLQFLISWDDICSYIILHRGNPQSEGENRVLQECQIPPDILMGKCNAIYSICSKFPVWRDKSIFR